MNLLFNASLNKYPNFTKYSCLFCLSLIFSSLWRFPFDEQGRNTNEVQWSHQLGHSLRVVQEVNFVHPHVYSQAYEALIFFIQTIERYPLSQVIIVGLDKFVTACLEGVASNLLLNSWVPSHPLISELKMHCWKMDQLLLLE